MSLSNLKLLDFSSRLIKVLHLSWFAIFLTFVMWFSHTPMAALDISNT